MASTDDSARIKNAAALLIKGGTLTSDQCEKCGGLMIRFGDKTACINCGSEKTSSVSASEKTIESPSTATPAASDLGSTVGIVEQKIVRLAIEIGSENDIMLQKQKADLLETYLRILEKVKSLSQ
jgi:uncharacterized Zn finger protein (UPF0148 family)